MSQCFQESLSREKSLEDKLIKVKGMISKNIGRSQTDLMRAFEDIKQEIMSLDGSNSASPRTTSAIDDMVSYASELWGYLKCLDSIEKINNVMFPFLQIASENMTLTKKIHELGEQLGEQRTEISLLQGDQEDILKDARMKEQLSVAQ